MLDPHHGKSSQWLGTVNSSDRSWLVRSELQSSLAQTTYIDVRGRTTLDLRLEAWTYKILFRLTVEVVISWQYTVYKRLASGRILISYTTVIYDKLILSNVHVYQSRPWEHSWKTKSIFSQTESLVDEQETSFPRRVYNFLTEEVTSSLG